MNRNLVQSLQKSCYLVAIKQSRNTNAASRSIRKACGVCFKVVEVPGDEKVFYDISSITYLPTIKRAILDSGCCWLFWLLPVVLNIDGCNLVAKTNLNGLSKSFDIQTIQCIL